MLALSDVCRPVTSRDYFPVYHRKTRIAWVPEHHAYALYRPCLRMFAFADWIGVPARIIDRSRNRPGTPAA